MKDNKLHSIESFIALSYGKVFNKTKAYSVKVFVSKL